MIQFNGSLRPVQPSPRFLFLVISSIAYRRLVSLHSTPRTYFYSQYTSPNLPLFQLTRGRRHRQNVFVHVARCPPLQLHHFQLQDVLLTRRSHSPFLHEHHIIIAICIASSDALSSPNSTHDLLIVVRNNLIKQIPLLFSLHLLLTISRTRKYDCNLQ